MLFPTLGLFMPFLRDAEWAVVLCRAYNTMLYSGRHQPEPAPQGCGPAAAAGSAGGGARAGARACGELGFVGAMVSADSYYLLGHARFDPIYATAQRLRGAPRRPRGGHGHAGGRPRALPQVHPGPHLLARLRPDAPDHLDDVRRRPRALPRADPRLPGGGLGLDSLTSCSAWTRSTRSAATRRPSCLRKSPTEYVRQGRIYFSCEADEPLLPQALAYVGDDRIMYASDFPHWDHSYPKSVKELADRRRSDRRPEAPGPRRHGAPLLPPVLTEARMAAGAPATCRTAATSSARCRRTTRS